MKLPDLVGNLASAGALDVLGRHIASKLGLQVRDADVTNLGLDLKRGQGDAVALAARVTSRHNVIASLDEHLVLCKSVSLGDVKVHVHLENDAVKVAAKGTLALLLGLAVVTRDTLLLEETLPIGNKVEETLLLLEEALIALWGHLKDAKGLGVLNAALLADHGLEEARGDPRCDRHHVE